ncbi:MAG TPA: YcaO-like family protein, partial [Patescibacteria group bacterium]|nr:YcaO-like family protein [Patescibacteria group bacterium]
ENMRNPLQLASYEEMYERALDISRLPRYYDTELDSHRRILWVEGVDLFTNQQKWSPFEVVHADYAVDAPSGNGFVSSSNGLSSGNNHHEAIIHGLCEVIERDALTLWTISTAEKQFARKIRLDSVTERRAIEILDRFFAADIAVGIWDITSDTGVPAFLCRTLPNEPDVSGARPASGMGCHLSRDVALLRALTEAAQSRLTFISGARDDMPRSDYGKYLSAEAHAKWLAQIEMQGSRNLRRIASLETQTFDHDIAVLLDSLRRAGIREAVAVDLTIDGLNIPVTRVVVPGLEGILSRKGTVPGERAGRLLPGGPNG